jgi:hypothetical protein
MIVRVAFTLDTVERYIAATNAVDVVTSNLALNGEVLFRSRTRANAGHGEFIIETENYDDADIVSGVIMSFLPSMVTSPTAEIGN